MAQTELIESLQKIVNDSNSSLEERTTAANHIIELTVSKAEQTETGSERREPTHDFLEYRVFPVWNRLLEPKLSCEKWLKTPETMKMIAQHDAAVAAKAAEMQANPADDELIQSILLRSVTSHFSWDWLHPTSGNGKHLVSTSTKEKSLWGQYE
jgi:hypothetical protein